MKNLNWLAILSTLLLTTGVVLAACTLSLAVGALVAVVAGLGFAVLAAADTNSPT